MTWVMKLKSPHQEKHMELNSQPTICQRMKLKKKINFSKGPKKWQETMVAVKKISFTSVCLRECLVVFHTVWTCEFPMRAPTKKHSISWKIIDSPHQSRPHKKILFPRYIISQSSGGPQLRQLINQRSKTNIYISPRAAWTGYDSR